MDEWMDGWIEIFLRQGTQMGEKLGKLYSDALN